MRDQRFAADALALAQHGWNGAPPNPLVGALVVRDGTVVGRGFHARYGEAHAERVALDAAGRAADGATLYCNLEPCCYRAPDKHQPPCTEAIIESGVRRVVVSQIDPNPRVSGQGVAALRAAGVEVEILGDADVAWCANDAFNTAATLRRPFVQLKMAQSLDGRTATTTGASRWITGEAARAEGHRLRGARDAVMVGVGTVVADDPLLTVRAVPVERQPRAVVVDPTLRIGLAARLVRERPRDMTIVCAGGAPPAARAALTARGVHVVSVETGTSREIAPQAILTALWRDGIRSVLIEGGSDTISRFVRAGLYDRLTAFIAPLIVGGDGRAALDGLGVAMIDHAVRLERTTVRPVGDDVVFDGYRVGWLAETRRAVAEVRDVHRIG